MVDWSLGVIGVGNMGGALLKGVVGGGMVASERVTICERDHDRRETICAALGVSAAGDVAELAARVDVILLCVKPQVLMKVLGEMAPAMKAGQILISVAAGITLGQLQGAVPVGVEVVRVMPNTPCLIGEGTSGYVLGGGASDRAAEITRSICEAVGVVVALESESQMNALIAVSGSGPGYVFHLIEAMAAGGVALGLSADVAVKLAMNTVRGAASLALQSDAAPGVLRQRVMSPGGTTEAAIHYLDGRDFQAIVVGAERAAADRGEAMAAEMGGS